MGRADALRLTREVSKIIVVKGKKITTFDMKKDPPTPAELLKALLGPTGNLRAPVIRRGRTLLVGFHEDVYAEMLGGA